MSAPTGILSVVQDRMLAMLREVLRPAFSRSMFVGADPKRVDLCSPRYLGPAVKLETIPRFVSKHVLQLRFRATT
jgi:hypothetical protein